MFSLKKPLINLALVLLFSNQAYSNVLVSLDDVEVPGYTDEIIVPVTIENSENSVGGIPVSYTHLTLPTTPYV